MSRLQKLCAAAAVCAGGALLAAPLAGASTASVATHTGASHASKKTKIKTKANPGPKATLVLGVEQSKYGAVLTSGAGKTLYETTRNCTSTSCEAVWPPALAKGKLAFGRGVNSKLVKEVKIGKASEQITYSGHRLYFYVGDTRAHEYTGEGLNSPWGVWHVVSAANGHPMGGPVAKTGSKKSASAVAKSKKKATSTTKPW